MSHEQHGPSPMRDRPSILCLMRMPPALTGHGGSQRGWRLVEALCRIGRVHVVLLHRSQDRDFDHVSLAPLRALVETVTVVAVADWSSIKYRLPWLPWRIAMWCDMIRIGSGEAPRLPRRAIAAIAAALPGQSFDMAIAARLPCAVIADRLIDAGRLRVAVKVVDLDDRLSTFKRRQRAAERPGPILSLLHRLDIAATAQAERSMRRWDAISLCSDEDVARMAAEMPGTPVVKLPNVIDRPLLASATGDGFAMLFVGNLDFPPNRQGLARFVAEAWPLIRAARPDATATVVGFAPGPALRAALARAGIALHANVPSVEPFYQAAQAVICPIFFGGGTRIKLLEAMAYGRAIVSTTLGAEGLDIVPGVHALIADTMPAFAHALIRLAGDLALREALAANARALQQERFAPAIFAAAAARLVDAAQKNRSATRRTSPG
ncbi:glycosyltransferase [Sphingomonas bacterium]|uniref:glycosyltransferase n=1 Tax=Sphingomonas bacterium TaxID=1895847 RepID=UPI0015754431|nr:glycosyltransferase [Sphingomonas bacterium]